MKSIYHNHKDHFITLADLNIKDVPRTLNYNSEKFIVKSEFHITLLAVGQVAEIIDKNNVAKLQKEIVDDFNTFTEKFPLTEYEILNDTRLVTVGGNKTIIVMVKLEGIDELFQYLENKYQKRLPVQPTHITLYTLPTDTFGIPILSYDELENISEPSATGVDMCLSMVASKTIGGAV